jgi:hypothetical protein
VIQSFKPGEVEPEKAHEIGKELTQNKFDTYECVVCTHIDKDHIHNHIIINSVNKETGKMYRSTKEDLREIKKANDRICEKERLSVPEEKKNRYFTMAKEKSSNKKEFIENMEKEGYKVNWTDSRKYITYTLPEGNKFRDKSLPNDYSKEVMENGFRGIEKEKYQGKEEGRATGETRVERKQGSEIDRDFREFFGGKTSFAHHESQSNDSNRELHGSKERDGELEGESRRRQEIITGSDKELRRDFEGGQKGKRRADRQSNKGFEGRTRQNGKGITGDLGELHKTTEFDSKRINENQRTGETRRRKGIKTHVESSKSKHNSNGDIDDHSMLNNKSMADTEIEVKHNISKAIIESVKRDLQEITGRATEGEKEPVKEVNKSKEHTQER